LSSLVKAGLVISVGLFLGRISGLFREVMIASTFGVSGEADVAILILTIPDLLVNVLVGGAMSAALLPEFRRLGHPRAAGLFVQASLVVVLGFAFVTILASLFSNQLVFVFAPGLEAERMQQTASLVSLTLWLIPLTTLAGISTAYLHAFNRFGVASLGTLIYNLAVIAGLALIALNQGGLRLLCAFIILGGVLRWSAQLLALPRPISPKLALRQPLINRKLMLRYLQASSAGGLLLLLPVAARALASFSGEGAIATFNYALKLTEFALGVSITVLSVAIFPRLAESFSAQDEARFGQQLNDGLWWLVVLALVTIVPLAWFSRHFVELAYGWGRMNGDVLKGVTTLMIIGLLSLPFQGLSSLLTAASNARRDSKGPLQANLSALLVFLPLGSLMHVFFGLAGIMIALVLCHVVAVIAQLVLLSRRHQLSVGDMLLSAKTIKAATLILLIGSALGWLTADQYESALAGVSLAGLSAAIALAACLGMHSEYRSRMLNWLRQR
jgi:putative peptidoglycan lipid II flippase